jgi:dephospho-CoA kinase
VVLFAIIDFMNSEPKRIVIVGHPLSGKDTVGKYLENKYGFSHISTGRLLREYIKENDLGVPTRDLMQRVANDIRRDFGVDYFVKRALAVGTERITIDGLRTIGEIEAAKAAGATVIAVTASVEKRFSWSQSRLRDSDKATFEEFKEQENAENHSIDDSRQNVIGVIDEAEYTICNEGSIDDLNSAVDLLMSEIGILEREKTTC